MNLEIRWFLAGPCAEEDVDDGCLEKVPSSSEDSLPLGVLAIYFVAFEFVSQLAPYQAMNKRKRDATNIHEKES